MQLHVSKIDGANEAEKGQKSLLVGVISPVYTRPLNCFGSQVSLSWLRVNALNRFTNRYLNRFLNHVWEVV